jgi:hypothetical protein
MNVPRFEETLTDGFSLLTDVGTPTSRGGEFGPDRHGRHTLLVAHALGLAHLWQSPVARGSVQTWAGVRRSVAFIRFTD